MLTIASTGILAFTAVALGCISITAYSAGKASVNGGYDSLQTEFVGVENTVGDSVKEEVLISETENLPMVEEVPEPETMEYGDDVSGKYLKAKELLRQGQYKEAKDIFLTIQQYSDVAALIQECDYQKGLEVLANGDYDGAKMIFAAIHSEKAAIMVTQCDYEHGNEMLMNHKESEAGPLLWSLLENEKWLEYFTAGYGGSGAVAYGEENYDSQGNSIILSRRVRYWHAGAATIIVDYFDDDDIPDRLSVRAVGPDGEGYGYFDYDPKGNNVGNWIFENGRK